MSRVSEPAEMRERPARRYPPALVMTSMALLGVVFAIFIFADALAPFDYRTQALRNRLAAPAFLGGSWTHLLGTDELTLQPHCSAWRNDHRGIDRDNPRLCGCPFPRCG